MLIHHLTRLRQRGLVHIACVIVALLSVLLAGCADITIVIEPSQPADTAIATVQPTRTARATRPTRATVTPRPTVTTAASQPRTMDGLRVVMVDDLPKEALETLALIEQGGPFPYRQDGAVFQNRERILPRQRAGYYHEYTVETPGSPDRGARRIVTGAGGEIYYTADHYNSFVRVIQP